MEVRLFSAWDEGGGPGLCSQPGVKGGSRALFSAWGEGGVLRGGSRAQFSAWSERGVPDSALGAPHGGHAGSRYRGAGGVGDPWGPCMRQAKAGAMS